MTQEQIQHWQEEMLKIKEYPYYFYCKYFIQLDEDGNEIKEKLSEKEFNEIAYRPKKTRY